MFCVKKYEQDLLQEDEICIIVRMIGQKVRSNGAVSNNTGPNINREMLTCKWLRAMGTLLTPHVGVMLVNVLLFLFFFWSCLPHSLQLQHLRP
ncbi:hypothetical protein TNCV_2323371 [Trichonephila clavipes]|nr:hypothetical protein TNCV_2323371 [Trichonephila clavipes]